MTRAKTDLEVMAPTPTEVVIGDRVFVQKPLSLRGTARLVVALSEEIQRAATSDALDSLLAQDLNEASAGAMVPALIQVLSGIPNALPRIITIILTGDDDKEDVEFVDVNTRLVQAMRILRTFVDQNEPEELVENFMVLRSTLSDALSKAKAKTKTATV